MKVVWQLLGRSDTFVLSGVLLVQGICLLFLLSEEFFEIASDDPNSPYYRMIEGLEVLVMLGLCSGFIITLRELKKMAAKIDAAQRQLGVARGIFHEVLEAHFDGWSLTPAQRDVALLALKGLTNAEIAEIRQTKEGTIKAQLNSVYGKAGVSGRSQFVGLFVEELMAGPVAGSSSQI
ncbi:MAG: helix-turn-helix transcriptional regulator [Magnetovibrionaceae bacterium]